jgi:starch synthase
MKVLFATPEVSDFVQVGGLAAVSAALPRALRRFADIRIVTPGYPEVLSRIKEFSIVGHCPATAELPACSVGLGHAADGLPAYVIICPQLYERRGTPYGNERGEDWADNDLRFARFSLAAALLAQGRVDPGWSADLIHANDWQSGLIPGYLAWSGAQLPTVFTIHNLAYQGLFEPTTIHKIGAPDAAFDINGLEFYNKLSFIKAGIFYASHVTTVSQTYAQEITTPEFGCGLDGLLRKRAEEHKLSGILNGIDESWDPRNCPALSQTFEAGDWRARSLNTAELRRQFGLAVSRGPLFAVVARLVHQKGVDLVLDAAETIIAAGGQLIVTGKGDPQFEHALLQAQRHRPDAVAVRIGFDKDEARNIFAGSDFTLVPSRFEPCGLSQMYAQRFGSLPVGHRTGGLAETIVDGETGFLFRKASTASLLSGLCRAFSVFGASERFGAMRRAAMTQTFGWSASASSYLSLYRTAASGA